MIYPKDDENRKIGTRARQLVLSAFDVNHWDFYEITGTDHGTDCEFELIENDEYRNHGLRGQIKGTKALVKLMSEEAVSKNVELKLINYALGSAIAFVVFLAGVEFGDVYYLPIQDYFISHPKLYKKSVNGQGSMNIHIPLDNVVSKDDTDLQEIAKSRYVIEEDGRVVKLDRKGSF